MRLGARQELHSKLIAQHILWLIKNGYAVRGGDWFRDARVHGFFGEDGPDDGGSEYGHASSEHKLKCATDLYLVKDGKFLSKTSEHRESGEKWESRHKLCVWGGRFNDGNHYQTGGFRTTGGF